MLPCSCAFKDDIQDWRLNLAQRSNRELTNRRLSRDAAAGSRHSSALNVLQKFEFTIRSKDDDVGARQANFPAVSEVYFLLFTSKLVCSTKMFKFIGETRARIADAYGNRFIMGRVFHCICTFMRFVNKLRVNYGFRQDNKGRMQGAFIYRKGIYKLAEQLQLL